jgi:hypothetical protein
MVERIVLQKPWIVIEPSHELELLLNVKEGALAAAIVVGVRLAVLTLALVRR